MAEGAALDSESNSDGSFPFPAVDNDNHSDESRRGSSSSASSGGSEDSNETIKVSPLLPHELPVTTPSPWAAESSMGSPSSTSMARRIQLAKSRHRRHPLLRDLDRMQSGDAEYIHASVLEPELQYEQGQGSWFPPSSGSIGMATSDNQRHWGEFCASPEPMTPSAEDQDDEEVRRSLQPLFDMEIFGNDEESSDKGRGACATIETETDIISSLEEGYLPSPAPALEVSAYEDGEEASSMKRSESLVSFKDLDIPPPRAPAPAPIAALKRRVSSVCESAKGSKAAAATSSFVGNIFDYLIEKGF